MSKEKAETSDAKRFIMFPEPLQIAGNVFTHENLVEFFIDSAPEFKGAAAGRIGRDIMDAMAKARRDNLPYYSLSLAAWKKLHAVAEKDETAYPEWFNGRVDKNGAQIPIPFGVMRYLPLVDPIDLATATAPKLPEPAPVQEAPELASEA